MILVTKRLFGVAKCDARRVVYTAEPFPGIAKHTPLCVAPMRLFPFLVDEPSRDNNLMQGITRENARFLLRYFCIGSSERASLTRTKRIRHSTDPKVPA